MAKLERQVDLVLDTVRITGQRVVFSAKKSLAKEPNTLDMRVYNLKEQTRSQLQGRGLKVSLLAGTAVDGLGRVFTGETRTCDHVRDGTEWVTHVQCGDGEESYRTARFVESFAPGTQVVDVVLACARALRVGEGNVAARMAAGLPRNFQQFAHGFTAHGNAAQVIDKLIRSAGLTWSIQDGTLQVLGKDDVAKEDVVLLTPTSGLVGSPEHGSPDKKGGLSALKVKCRLQPRLRPGGRFKLESQFVRGVFRVEKLTHTGDSISGPWETEMEAKPSS